MKIGSFLKHFLGSSNRYKVHSPFVYEFVTRVLPHRLSAEGAKIAEIRKQLGKSAKKLSISDFGAGYSGQSRPVIEKTLCQVVKSSARKRRQGELLKRIAEYYKPASCLELGTNLGFSAMYIASGLPEHATFHSIEGSDALAEIARANLQKIGKKATVINSEFSDALSSKIELSVLKPELVFLDGHHRLEPTLKYFSTIVPHMPDGSLFIMDDIHWSDEMLRAWKTIIAKDEVTVSIDLFSFGLCFIRRNQAKEHFMLRF